MNRPGITDTFTFGSDTFPLRLERTWRLVGPDGLRQLRLARAVVVGLGGVGSFTAEALVRSGIGHLTLVDFDQVCVSNVNRQLHAMGSTLGAPKAEVMADRLRDIAPDATIAAHVVRCSEETVTDLIRDRGAWVADCIDQVDAKCHLIAACHRAGVRIVTSLGAAARMDPTRVQVADLSRTHTDPLARVVRRRLRRVHGMVCDSPTGIPAVFSTEAPRVPWVPEQLRRRGLESSFQEESVESRKQVLGSAVFVTAVVGMTVASVVVREVLERTARGEEEPG